MAKKFSGVSQFLSRFRGWFQAGAALLTNLHLPNFLKGGLYQGAGKAVCVPGLNCYSCPGAAGACPIGAFQAVVGSSKFGFSYYITGFLILLGVLLGRFICGFLCPFGWFQELLHKIPFKKFSTKRLKPLRYLKYAVLLVMVFLLPLLLVNDVGMGDPFFCKYLCPQGVLEGAIPLSFVNSGIRSALGALFTWKLSILIALMVLSVMFYRPFCKWLCPLGAFYALLNKVSLFQMKVDKNKCVSCGKCAKACKMDVDVTKTPNHTECIRCGMCIRACPTNAVRFRYGMGSGKDKIVEKDNVEKDTVVAVEIPQKTTEKIRRRNQHEQKEAIDVGIGCTSSVCLSTGKIDKDGERMQFDSTAKGRCMCGVDSSCKKDGICMGGCTYNKDDRNGKDENKL